MTALALGTLAPARAAAQEAPAIASEVPASAPARVGPRELDAWVDETPRLRGLMEAAEADLGDVTAAGTLENPLLSYDFMGLLGGEPTNGGTQSQVMLAQTFPWPGQLEARVDAANARLAADRGLVELARFEVRIALRRALVDLAAAQMRVDALDAQVQTLEPVVGVVRGRSEAGAGRRWDAMRTDAELATLVAARDGARADVALAQGALAALLGRARWDVRATSALDALEVGAGLDEVADHPARRAAHAALEAAESALRRERALVLEGPTVRLGGVFSSAPEGGYLAAGLSMPLPVFDLHRGAIERAEHEVLAARALEEATAQALEAAANASRAALATSRTALEAFDASTAAHASEVAEMAEAAFRGGEISAFELLDALRGVRELSLARIERLEAVRRAELDLLAATGSREGTSTTVP